MSRDEQNLGEKKSNCQTTWLGHSLDLVRVFPRSSSLLLTRPFRYTDNKVFVALSHGELCVFRRDMSRRLCLCFSTQCDVECRWSMGFGLSDHSFDRRRFHAPRQWTRRIRRGRESRSDLRDGLGRG